MSSTKLVAILNITPDSFSDGGAYATPGDAQAAAANFFAQGAHIVDIGAESTRPGAAALSPEEEWQRLFPILPGLQVPFSVDTRHAKTAGKALAAGARWINDVSGFSDDAMIDAVRDHDCRLVVMHSLSVPADPKKVMHAIDPVPEILAWGAQRLERMENAGIARSRLIFDPGIGFGKTPAQSLAILQGIAAFTSLGVPLLVGHSRKSFLGEGDRDAATLQWSRYLIAQGVDYLRVHDICAHKELL